MDRPQEFRHRQKDLKKSLNHRSLEQFLNFQITEMIFSHLSRFVLLWVFTFGLAKAASDDLTYILRPNDTIRMAVYEEPDLSVQVRILKTGQASFPLIGSVEVGGISVSAAAKKIRDLYAKDYLVDPKLTLTVDEYATEFISVIGSVKNPGQIPMPVSGNLDLASAMATAGGLAENADSNGIQLVRASGTTSNFSMASIEGAAGRTKLEAGDRVIVNQSAFVGKSVTVLGQVGKPGPVTFPLNGRLDLVNAVAMAGGLTELANPKKLSLNRKGTVTVLDFRQISQRGDRPFLLQPDDVITVAERLF
jgi:polysaccharide export outer membrane protein